MKKHYRHENDCLNCGTELQGKYCYVCGQENLEIKESFGHMLNHAVSDYFHFDHQFFSTLKPLLFQPGKLTNEYMAGKRVSYLHPVKMYIFISLIYFILLAKSDHNPIQIEDVDQTKTEQLKSAEKKADVLDKDGKVSKHVTKYFDGYAVYNKKEGSYNFMARGDTTYKDYLANQQKLKPNEQDGFWKRLYQKKRIAYVEKYGKERAKEEFFEEIRHNMPKMMFVLLPLFALILKIAFSGNHKFYVEHLIFAFHVHCFYFLLSGISLLIEALIPSGGQTLDEWLTTPLFLVTLFYFYKALRAVYHRTRFRTISKMIGISMMYTLAFTACILGLVIITGLLAG